MRTRAPPARHRVRKFTVKKTAIRVKVVTFAAGSPSQVEEREEVLNFLNFGCATDERDGRWQPCN